MSVTYSTHEERLLCGAGGYSSQVWAAAAQWLALVGMLGLAPEATAVGVATELVNLRAALAAAGGEVADA